MKLLGTFIGAFTIVLISVVVGFGIVTALFLILTAVALLPYQPLMTILFSVVASMGCVAIYLGIHVAVSLLYELQHPSPIPEGF